MEPLSTTISIVALIISGVAIIAAGLIWVYQARQVKHVLLDFDRIAESLMLPVECIYIVIHVTMNPQQYNDHDLEKPFDSTNHRSAREVCWAIRQFAIEAWGDDWSEELRKLDIQSSADIGRVVYALVDAGYLYTSPGDKMEDFDTEWIFKSK